VKNNTLTQKKKRKEKCWAKKNNNMPMALALKAPPVNCEVVSALSP